MTELQKNLATIIGKGVTLSKEEVNRSYLFSSFKRTVSSWNSDFKKAKDDKKLTELMNTMQKDATKYLEKTKDIIDNVGLVKNPKLYKQINEAKQNIDNMINFFNNAKNKAPYLCSNELANAKKQYLIKNFINALKNF